MQTLLKNAGEKYSQSLAEANMIATQPIGPAPKGIAIDELAAWTVAGNIILNLDEVFLKR